MTHLAPPPDKEWLTAVEAEAAALPGFELTERHIRRFLEAGSIATRKRQGRGGGREFHWTSLPPAARDEWLKRHGVLQNASHDAPAPAREAEKDLLAEARAIVAKAARDFIAARRLTIGKGLKAFSAAYERPCTIALEPWVRIAVPRVEPHQVRTWWRALKTDAPMAALRDKRGRKQGSGLFDTDFELKNYAIAAIAARPHLSAKKIRKYIIEDLGREIPLRTLQLFMQRLKRNNKALIEAVSHPDAHRSHHQPAFGNLSYRADAINALWEIDASPGDVMCVADGRPCRVKLTAVIDVFTRRARVLVSDQPRAVATMALLRRAILDFGLPVTLKADNGKEFKSRSVEAFCTDLGIALELSRPFSPEQKAHVERFFGTILHDLFEDLPGYLGHNVAQRKAIESRKSFAHRFGEDANLAFEAELSPSELQARIDTWLTDVYEQRLHGGLDTTPFAQAQDHAHEVRRLADERALDRLLLVAPGEGGRRIVGKKGIALFNRFFVHDQLGYHMGRQVSVRFDPHDLARIAVYDATNRAFLCVAVDPSYIPNAELMTLAAKAKANSRAVVRELRDNVRKVQQLFPAAGMGDRLLLSASRGIDLSDDAREAMQLAHPPRLIASAALDASTEQPLAVDATPEQLESANVILAGFAAQDAPAPERAVQCDGYERPAFVGDDMGFWHWAMTRLEGGNALDERDVADIAELEDDENFQLKLTIAAKTAAA